MSSDSSIGPIRDSPGLSDRAGSALVGVILLFGMVLLGMALIVGFGLQAVDDVKQRTDAESAELSMQEFRAEANSMAMHDADSVQFEFATDDSGQVSVVQDGSVEFALNGLAACTATQSMGMVRHESGDGEVTAYEANGVWKKTGPNSSSMVDPPNIQYSTRSYGGAQYRTLNYPLVNVNATESDLGGSSSSRIRNTDGELRAEIEREMCLRGPSASTVDSVDNVTIRIKDSTFYHAWANYLEETFGHVATVDVSHGSNTVVVRDIPLGRIPGSCTEAPPSAYLVAANGSESGDRVTVAPGQQVTLTGGATDPDVCSSRRGIVNQSITGPGGLDVDGNGATYSWSSPGTKTITYTVEDDDGSTTTETATVEVDPSAPSPGPGMNASAPCHPSSLASPTASLTADNATGTYSDTLTVSTGDPVTFDGTAGDPDGCGPTPGIRNASVFSTGFSDDGNTTTRSFGTPGEYVVTYLVIDNEGDASTDKVTVRVTGSGGSIGGGGGATDDDGDGIANVLDECPSTAASGQNGCSPLAEDPDGLLVNQSSGALRVLGSGVTRTNVSRIPFDLVFSLPGTESMLRGQHAGYFHSNSDVTVPNDRVYRIRGRERLYGPGETVPVNRTETIVEYEVGSDPRERRVDAARAGIDELSASDGDRAGWSEYRVRPRELSDCTVSNAGLPECVERRFAPSNDLGVVRSDVGSVHSFGGTFIGAGIAGPLDDLGDGDSGDRDVIVLLADEDHASLADATPYTENYFDDTTLALADRAAARNVTIYTVGLGDDADDDLLRRVANRTGGEYYQVDDAADLEGVFRTVVRDATRLSRRVQFNDVPARVRVADTPNATTVDVGDVNDPSGPGNGSTVVSPDDPGWTLSLTATVNRCENPTDTGSQATYGGEAYNRTVCSGSTATGTVGGSAPGHRVYLDGDAVPAFTGDDSKPWKRTVREIVTAHDPGLVSGNRFNLSPNQAVVVTRFSQGNFTVALFEADDTPRPGPRCRDREPTGTLNVAPGTNVTTGTSITVEGTATDQDTCAAATAIADESITAYDDAGSVVFSENDNRTTETFPGPGTYTVVYEAEDDEGRTLSLTESVVVSGPGSSAGGSCVDGSPRGSLGASETTVEVGESVTIRGDAVDGDACGSGIVNRTLTGPGVSAGSSATVVWNSTGTRTITYTVEDGEGNTNTTDVTIDVVSPTSGTAGPNDGFIIGIGGQEVAVDDAD